MKLPISWLNDYVEVSDIDIKKLAHELTMSGSKVETVEEQGKDITNVVVGKIIELEKHPDADKLQVSKIDIGSGVIQVVTGATNIKVGDYIPVALVGANLPGGKISKGKLRGVESSGMMCSISELNLKAEDFPDSPEDGIMILGGSQKLGTDIKEILSLNQAVIEFEITSNRPDCLSVTGIARETAVTFGKPLNIPTAKPKEEADSVKEYVTVEVKEKDLCPRYAARIVKDVKVGPSPKWLRDRLLLSGVRPINNIVDITNYVMLEFGQPMHAFDLSKISDKKIIVRRALEGEEITTLDGQDRVLDSSVLVIADGQKAVAVAGVMGGANSEVEDGTKTILLESANFNGLTVRMAAKKLGVRTEASGRFEKGLDVEGVITAIDRAAELIEQLGAGTVCKGVVDCYSENMSRTKVILNPEAVNAFLGTAIETSYMIRLFKDLGFEVNEATMELLVPSFRSDINHMADLAEEVARFYGYNNITATMLSGSASTQGKKTFSQKVRDIIKETMISCGLSETYTYSFSSQKVFDKLLIPEGDALRNYVKISNPLGEEYSAMRTTTVPGMLETISRNYNRSIESAGFFELSYVYLQGPSERPILTVGMYGGDKDFYCLKGVIEELMHSLGIENAKFEATPENPMFHPGRAAKVTTAKGKQLGFLGEVHPGISENFECPKRTYVAVLDVLDMLDCVKLSSQYRQLPKFPAMSRDIAVVVGEKVLVGEIEEIINQRAGKILEEVKLFDVYRGKPMLEGQKSVAYSMTFRASDRTLTDDEVNKAMSKILSGLENVLGAKLR